MAIPEIDFEGKGGSGSASNSNQGGANNGTQGDNGQGNQIDDDATSLNGGENNDITGKDNNPGNNQQGDNNKPKEGEENNNDNSSTGALTEGDTIEFEGHNYSVDKDGNLVDDKGAIFKEAKDVDNWLKSMQVAEEGDDNTLSLSSIQETIGITVTDADGKPIEFTEDAKGVKAYIDSVIDLKSNELQQAAINKVFAENPMLKQFIDYVQLNGTPRGFGEIPDRSGVVLDKDNESQLIAVIKMAAAEFGNKSLNDNYIKYLRDSGGLYDEAKAQLIALQDKDVQYRKDIEARAAAQREADQKSLNDYWNKVSKAIDSRIISGYKLPESFTKEVNGQKIVYTPNDFYNYLSRATEQDGEGNRVSGYQRDLNNLTEEDYLNRELLDAWLMFTGGSYKDLINMAVNEDKVRQLKVKSKEQRTSKTIKIVKKASGKTGINDIVLS